MEVLGGKSSQKGSRRILSKGEFGKSKKRKRRNVRTRGEGGCFWGKACPKQVRQDNKNLRWLKRRSEEVLEDKAGCASAISDITSNGKDLGVYLK